MWNIEATTGYKPKTTFWNDFTIAERFGEGAIRGTFNTAFKQWKSNYIYLTELAMVLNWKAWDWYEAGNGSLTELYTDLWTAASEYANDHLTGEELSYFFRVTD